MSGAGMTLKPRWAQSATADTSGTATPQSGCGDSAEATTAGPANVARLLLDSTVLIDALRGRPAAARVSRLRRNGVEPWVCAVSVEEIWRGLRPGEEAIARRLFNALRLAPLGVAQAVQAGIWRRTFAEHGVTLHQADCLIAAAANGIGASLATANVDEYPMPEVALDHWPVGV